MRWTALGPGEVVGNLTGTIVVRSVCAATVTRGGPLFMEALVIRLGGGNCYNWLSMN